MGLVVSSIGVLLAFVRGRRKVNVAISGAAVSRPQDVGVPGRHSLVPVIIVTVTAKGEPVPLTDVSLELVRPKQLPGFGVHTLAPLRSIGNTDHAPHCTVVAGRTETWAFTVQSDDPPEDRRVKLRAVVSRGDQARTTKSKVRTVAINRSSDGHPFSS
jgi:hypothetical protein